MDLGTLRLQAYLDYGHDEPGITLHGSPEHHDELVRRKGAWKTAVDAAAYAKAQGARVSISLMPNRCFGEDAAELDQVIKQLDPEKLFCDAKQSTVGTVADQLENGVSLDKLFSQPQDELYCTIHQNCRLYIGGTKCGALFGEAVVIPEHDFTLLTSIYRVPSL